MDGEELIEFKGTHGTAQSNADRILRANFIAADGRFGTAVYLWNSGAFAPELAWAWHKYYKDNGCYRNAANKSCAVLSVSGKVPESRFFDLEDRTIREIIERQCKRAPNDTKKVIARLITDLGKKIGHRVEVVRGQQQPPKGFVSRFRNYRHEYLGNPIVLAVMDIRVISNISQIEVSYEEDNA